MTKAEKDAIRARCEALLDPAPWRYNHVSRNIERNDKSSLSDPSVARLYGTTNADYNGLFLAHARRDIPALLEALEEAEEEYNRLFQESVSDRREWFGELVSDRDHWKAERDRWKEQADKYEDRLVISPYGDDKIDELEDAIEYAKTDRDRWKLLASQNLKTAELTLEESDRWKARAKALERALREDGSCVTCAYVTKGTLEEPCCACDRGQGNFYNWQFDEARFSKQEDAK